MRKKFSSQFNSLRKKSLRNGIITSIIIASSTLLLSFFVLKLYSIHLGIRNFYFLRENQFAIFSQDDWLGYRNQPHFSDYAKGVIKIQTNNRGFRSTQETADQKTPGTKRILGIGDSVLWGVGIEEDKTFFDLVGESLKAQSPWEDLNASVIGYSSLQEQRYLERDLLSLNPDLVLIQFCINDDFPTEDPFHRMPMLYREDLESLKSSPEIREMIEFFRQPDPIRKLRNGRKKLQDFATKIWIERPILKMNQVLTKRGIRGIFLFIPPIPRGPTWDQSGVRKLESLISKAGGEWIEFNPEYFNSHLAEQYEAKPLPSQYGKTGKLSLIEGILHVRAMKKAQIAGDYLDSVHLSLSGHKKIAEEIIRFMNGEAPSPGVFFGRR